MTSRERDVSNKYLKLITYHVQRYYNYFRMFFLLYYGVLFKKKHLRFGKLDIDKYKVIAQILTILESTMIVDVIYDLLIVVPIPHFSNNLTVIILSM